MTMLTKLFCALTVTSSEEYWSKYINENDSKDIKVVHEGVQDSCNQCDQQVIVQTSLKTHKEVVHESVKYLGDHCDYQSLENNRFWLHSESFRGGVTSVIKKQRKI